MKLHHGTQGWEVPREQCARGQSPSPASRLSPDLRGLWSGIWQVCTGAEVDWFRLTCFRISLAFVSPALVRERPQGWAPAQHMLWSLYTQWSCCSSVTWCHFVTGCCREGSGKKLPSLGSPTTVTSFFKDSSLSAASFTQAAETAHLRKSSRVMLAAASGPGYTSLSHWVFTKICVLLRTCQFVSSLACHLNITSYYDNLWVLQMIKQPTRTPSCAACSRLTCPGRGAGLDYIQMPLPKLPNSVVMWFYDTKGSILHLLSSCYQLNQ